MSNTVIQTNVLALNAHRNMTIVSGNQAKASARLSSGYRVNSAADDAAGLAISEKMRSQIRGLDMAAKNAQDGVSLIQTAEGSLKEIGDMVQRIRELVVQAANNTNEPEDRNKIANEIQQLQDEITNMASRTEFNKKVLATGKFSPGETATNPDTLQATNAAATAIGGNPAVAQGQKIFLQIGANANQKIDFNIKSLTASSLGISNVANAIKTFAAASMNTGETISKIITYVDKALDKVTQARSDLGAVQNRLEYTINNLKTSSENLSASESRIRDADMAKEMMNLTKSNVLQQAANSMLAQANQAPQAVLRLLQ